MQIIDQLSRDRQERPLQKIFFSFPKWIDIESGNVGTANLSVCFILHKCLPRPYFVTKSGIEIQIQLELRKQVI